MATIHQRVNCRQDSASADPHHGPDPDPQAETRRRARTIRTQLETLWVPGSLRELRIIGTSQGTVAGFFTGLGALAEAAAPFVGRAQLYTTVNLVDPALPATLGCAQNRLVVKPASLTGDADIVRRVLIFVDVDPVRDPHLSATDVEHRAALGRVDAICAWLIAHGVSVNSLVAFDSGNGGYCLPRIDLPNTPDAAQLVARFTRAIAAKFTDAEVHVDATVANAARLMKLVGTVAMKGPNTPDRPHRTASLLIAPSTSTVVPESVLQEIAALAPDDPADTMPPPEPTVPYSGPPFDVDAWVRAHAAHLPPMSGWRAWRTAQGLGRKRHFRHCPWRAAHVNKAAFLGQMPSGAVVAGCLHESCQGESWATLRDLVESALVIEM
jgi:hypothetical protein